MKNIKDLIVKVGVFLFLAIIVFFNLKGCAYTTWGFPQSPKTYSMEGVAGRVFLMTFLPSNEIMIWYLDPNNANAEGILANMRGTFGTHYFWRLWKVDRVFPFNFRIYPADTEPVDMEITVLEHYIQGRRKPTFTGKGKTIHEIILFGKDKIRFQDLWLNLVPYDPDFVEILLDKLKGGPLE
ncbi:MAG: hypothetical protein ACLQED_13045 [Desulfobaccales bacterium]